MTDEEMIADIKTKRPDSLWAVWLREPMLSRARELVAKGLLEEYYYVCRPDSGGRYSLPSTIETTLPTDKGARYVICHRLA